MRGSTIFVAVPVYRGTAFVAETLRSILGQSHRDLRVQISVDGHDSDSAEACLPFLVDERVRMEVQARQLGWVDNMNWLIDACDGDYFCYWQQDDHCAPQYFELLMEAFSQHPDAACAYSDLRWFGRSTHDVAMPALAGFTQQRILGQIESFHWIPLRGLVPIDVLRRVGHIRGLHDSITFSDYLWVLRLAAAGDLVRVPEVLYFKRDHADSASKTAASSYHVPPREAWIELGLAIFSEVAPHFSPGDRSRLALVIADRLVSPRPGRWFHYDAGVVSSSEPATLAMDFFRELEARSGVWPLAADAPGMTDGHLRALVHDLVPLTAGSTLPVDAASAVADRRSLVALARRRGEISLDCSSQGDVASVLLAGWSEPEDWGTWNDGHEASLWLPLPGDGGTWRIRLVGRPFAAATDPSRSRRLIISRDEASLLDTRIAAAGELPAFETSSEPGHGLGVTVRIDLPDAVSPAALGTGDDQRRLAFGLQRIDISRAR